MTEKKGTTKKKEPVVTDIPKPMQGYLCCDTCGMVVSYRGYREPTAKDPWPRHRCKALRISEVREFDRFDLEDPSFKPLPRFEAS